MTLRRQITIEEYSSHARDTPTREQWLRRIFSNRIVFFDRGKQYYYTALSVEEGEALHGRIGREITEKENLSPDQGFEKTQHSSWQAAEVIIDPTSHQNGQQLLIEIKPSVGTTNSIINALTNYLNKTQHHSPYLFDIGAISDPKTFWDFSAENKGKITSLTFEVTVPNMFGHANNFDEEMRKYREYEKAQKVSTTIKSPDGLDSETDTIKNAVDYTSKTGGTIKAKAKNKKYYNSNKNQRKVQISEIKETNTFIDSVKKIVSKIL